jgi:hypothetical protein
MVADFASDEIRYMLRVADEHFVYQHKAIRIGTTPTYGDVGDVSHGRVRSGHLQNAKSQVLEHHSHTVREPQPDSHGSFTHLCQ